MWALHGAAASLLWLYICGMDIASAPPCLPCLLNTSLPPLLAVAGATAGPCRPLTRLLHFSAVALACLPISCPLGGACAAACVCSLGGC